MSKREMTAVEIDVYGVRVRLECASDAARAAFSHDFAYFEAALAAERPDLMLRLFPAAARPAGWRRLFSGGRSTLYLSPGESRRVCFFGRAWLDYRFGEGRADVYSDDPDAAYEVLHQAALSFIGESLDRRGWHRVHGLGLAFGETGAVVLARSGGGKSTLALNLLSGPGPDILSDDTPLVAASGSMRAFPLRIALADEPPVDPTHVRIFNRARHNAKFVVSADFFRRRVRPETPVKWFIELRRTAVEPSRFQRSSRLRGAVLLLKWLVIGYETPQMWELFLRMTPASLAAKARILWARLRCWAALVGSCGFVQFHMSPDRKEAAAALRGFGGGHS